MDCLNLSLIGGFIGTLKQYFEKVPSQILSFNFTKKGTHVRPCWRKTEYSDLFTVILHFL